MIALSCRFCNATDLIRYGKNSSGAPRFHCKGCKKTFTPAPGSSALSAEKAAAIESALAERVSQRGIARMLNTSRSTIRAIRKKTRSA